MALGSLEHKIFACIPSALDNKNKKVVKNQVK